VEATPSFTFNIGGYMKEENTRIHEVRVYEGSTDEHGNTVLGKLKRVIAPKELQKLMNEKYGELKKYFKKRGHLSANILERPCVICKTVFLPGSNAGMVCSDKCRRIRQQNVSGYAGGKYTKTGLEVKKGGTS